MGGGEPVSRGPSCRVDSPDQAAPGQDLLNVTVQLSLERGDVGTQISTSLHFPQQSISPQRNQNIGRG